MHPLLQLDGSIVALSSDAGHVGIKVLKFGAKAGKETRKPKNATRLCSLGVRAIQTM